MPNFGVSVAILSGNKVLLTRREDFACWCFPGGAVEANESLAQAAVREAREETGLEIRIKRLVGLYSIPSGPNGGAHDILFTASPVGGGLNPDPREVTAEAWFGPEDLPDPISPWYLQEIRDVFSGVGGSAAWRQDYPWPFPSENRQRVYQMRDESGLSREAFFRKHFMQGAFPETLEVALDENKLKDGL